MTRQQKRSQSAGGVILNTRGDVCVVSQHATSWSLPKGHIEPGEDAHVAAKREVVEESGITQLTMLAKLGTYQRYRLGKHNEEDKTELKEITMFLYTTSQMDLAPTDPENPTARWVPVDDVADLLTHVKDKEFFLEHLPTIRKEIKRMLKSQSAS